MASKGQGSRSTKRAQEDREYTEMLNRYARAARRGQDPLPMTDVGLPGELNWCYHHPLLVGKDPAGYPSPPSQGAENMLEHAMRTEKTRDMFFATCQRLMAMAHQKGETTTDKEVKAELLQVEELRKLGRRLLDEAIAGEVGRGEGLFLEEKTRVKLVECVRTGDRDGALRILGQGG